MKKSTIIALVIVIAAGAWIVHAQNDKKAPQQVNTNQSSAQKSSGYLTIEEYRARLPINETIKNLKLGEIKASNYSSDDKSVKILAPELDESWTCTPDPGDGSKASIGNISITEQAKRSGPYEPLASKKLGTTTYGFEGSDTTNCTRSSRYKELVEAFKAQFQQLESY